jgi:hypothetical protein
MTLRGRPTWNKSVKLIVSALILGVAILNKSWPILFLPMILVGIEQWRMKITYSILAAVPSVISIFLYAQIFNSDFISIVTPAFTYNHGIGIWGYTYITKLGGYLGILPPEIFNFIIHSGRWITLGLMGSVFLIWVRHRAVLKGFLLILLSYYAFTHAFSIQYLCWIIPFAVIHSDRTWLRRYTLAAMIYMILAYFTLILDFRIDRLIPWPEGDLALPIPLSLPLWIITAIWLIQELKGKKINTFDQQTI